MSDKTINLRFIINSLFFFAFGIIKKYYQNREKKLLKAKHERNWQHRGYNCNSCSKPIRGARYKCLNCLSFDICEKCENLEHNVHDIRHLFLKIRIPLPPLVLAQGPCLDLEFSGENVSTTLEPEAVKELIEESYHRFNANEILDKFEQFKILQKNGYIDQEIFENFGAVGQKGSNLLTTRLFQFCDRDKDGKISFKDFIIAQSLLLKGEIEEKISCLFEIMDMNNDSYIEFNELLKVLNASYYLNKERFRDVLKILKEEAFRQFDDRKSKPLSCASFFFGIYAIRDAPQEPLVKTELQEVRPNEEIETMLNHMYTEAIYHLVKSVFEAADLDKDDKLSRNEFSEYAKKDTHILQLLATLTDVF